MAEDPATRIARMFGLGAYGDKLVAEILADYRQLIAAHVAKCGWLDAADEVNYYPGETE